MNYKYQANYKKEHYTVIPINLVTEKEADLIKNLKEFSGNRNKWIKDTIRNALIREARWKM